MTIPIIISVLATFLAVMGMAYALQLLLNPERTARDRIAELTGGPIQRDTLISAEPVQKAASSLSSLAAPGTEDERHLIRTKLIQAGFRSRNNLEKYSAIRAGLALALPLVTFLIVAQSGGEETRFEFKLFFVMFAATLGYYLPAVYLNSRLKKRQEELLRPFPDALDLLVSSVEAGLGVDAAFQRVAKEIDLAAPELSRELQMVNHEVAAGIPRSEALRRLDRRTGLSEVNSLVNVLTQAERFGTSVANALRVHSEHVRTKRMLGAEEQAAQISPKLTVAMILFILPSLFIILIGPAGINVFRNLLPALSGGQ